MHERQTTALIFLVLIMSAFFMIMQRQGLFAFNVGKSEEWVYERPFNLAAIMNSHGVWKMTESQDTIILALLAFPAKPTMLAQVISNLDPDKYDSVRPIISEYKQITPNLCFGIGNQYWNLNDEATHSLAVTILNNYIKDTKCISFENFDQMIANSGEASVLEFLELIHGLGFEHVIITNWAAPTTVATWPYIDAVQRSLDKTMNLQVNPNKVNKVLTIMPSVTVLSNYEAPDGMTTLASYSVDKQIEVMRAAADAQTSQIRWMPCWSVLYDAYAIGTLTWIANKLAGVDSTNPVTSNPVTSTTTVILTTTSQTINVYDDPFQQIMSMIRSFFDRLLCSLFKKCG